MRENGHDRWMRNSIAIVLVVVLAACGGKKDDAASGGSAGGSDQAERTGDRPDHPDPADRKQRLAAARERLDTNHDGKLSPDELSKATEPFLHFDDPASLDTDHDGDISLDELSAALRARRGQFHRGGGGRDNGGSATGGSAAGSSAAGSGP